MIAMYAGEYWSIMFEYVQAQGNLEFQKDIKYFFRFIKARILWSTDYSFAYNKDCPIVFSHTKIDSAARIGPFQS